MACVVTDANARFVFHPLDDGSQMLKAPAEIGTLPGCIFNHRRHALGDIQRDINRLGNATQTLRNVLR